MISIIIPSLPGYGELNTKCVDGYKGVTEEDYEIVLVEGDRSFAKNVNAGINRANGELLLITNNDVIPLPGWDKHFVQNADKGIVSFTPQPDCGWMFGMSKTLCNKIGYFSETLENSYEDYDYYIRAALQGYTRILAGTNFALHEGGHTLNKEWGTLDVHSPKRIEICLRNKRFMENRWPGIELKDVPNLAWSKNAVQIMKDWKRAHGTQISN